MKNKKKKNIKGKLFIRLIILLALLCFSFKLGQAYEKKPDKDIPKITKKVSTSSYPESNDIYNYLDNKDNRIKVYNRAVELNNGDSANTCVYFISEVLRQNGFSIDNSVCDTKSLLAILKKNDVTIIKDYTQLQLGDICFTTDESLNKDGVPSHTYVFMGWVEKGSYDFAYICDNQSKDYKNKIYHIRNIKDVYTLDGKTKEPFSFFIRKN